MRLPQFFFSSIRFKIFILYVIALSLTLTFFNLLIYWNHKEVLEHKIDLLLDARVQTVESAVLTYWKAEAKAAKSGGNWFADLFGGAQKKPGPEDPYDTVIRYLTYDDLLSPAHDNLRIFIDVFNVDGNLVDSSHSNRGFKVLDKAILHRVLQGQKVLYAFALPSEKGRVPGRALAKLLVRDGRASQIVQARVPMKPIRAELRELLVKLFARSAAVIVLASWGSFFLVKRTLSPVDQMTRMIRNIKPDNLDKRIQVPATADEIARLAETFNEMLMRLEKSFLSQRQIIQDVSHELKTPLTIVRGQIEVTLKKKRSAAEYEETLQSALEEVVKLRRIVDNLLLLAKFDNLGLLLEMKTLDLNVLLEDILQDIRLLGQEKSLRVSFVAGEPARVDGNEVYLERLFRNLLENAVKYNSEGGSIRVVSETEADTVKVTIEDTGVGIPPQEREKIFDRFYRIDRARASGDGFGLGLSIAKSVVDAHKGRIEVQSTPGSGTAFFVWLPVGRAHHFLSTH